MIYIVNLTLHEIKQNLFFFIKTVEAITQILGQFPGWLSQEKENNRIVTDSK